MNNDVLGESTVETTTKALLVLFVFLMLMISPPVKSVLVSQLSLLAGGLNGIAAGAVANQYDPRRDLHDQQPVAPTSNL